MFIPNPVTIGGAGIKKSSNKIADAATEIAKAAKQPAPTDNGDQPMEELSEQRQVEQAFIELQEARHEAEAAAHVLRTGGQTLGSLLNVKA